jgi:hypothetical protein
MERKVIDLEIVDELEGSGVDAIALVDSPAIEKNFMYFRQEKFVEPNKGETQEEYMGRCISNASDEGYPQDQAVAMCISKWENHSALEFAKISFDFDDTLSTKAGLELAKKYKDGGDTLYIISARNDVGQDMLDRASELGIPESRIHATGSNKAKVEEVKKLGIDKHIDNNADVIKELGTIGIKFAEECPIATQDIKVNLANRQNAIDTAHYGPLNPNLPNEEYWVAKAAMFNATVDEAKSARCGNCAFFNTSEAIKSCIAAGIGGESEDPYNVIDAGELGYCEAFDFKCASARTCDAWVVRTEKMEIDTTALPAYVDEVGKVKKKEVDLSAVLEFAKTAGLRAEDFLSNGLKFSEDSESIDLELAKGYTVYKYTGSVGSDTRDFCREMVGMDLYYTFDQIDAMGSMAVNPGFGLGGDDTYDIWKWKGGPNCKHRWTKFYVNEDGGYENKGAAPGIAGEKPNDMANNGYAFAAIEDKMELVGPVAIPDIEIPRKDKNGNVYFVRFSKEVVRRMAEKFMREQKLAESNIQHDGEQDGKSYVYESWIVEHPEDKANSVYNLDVPVGTWMCKMRVTDPVVWAKVKSGEVKGFILEGSFMDRADWEQYQKDREIYNKVIRILKNS